MKSRTYTSFALLIGASVLLAGCSLRPGNSFQFANSIGNSRCCCNVCQSQIGAGQPSLEQTSTPSLAGEETPIPPATMPVQPMNVPSDSRTLIETPSVINEVTEQTESRRETDTDDSNTFEMEAFDPPEAQPEDSDSLAETSSSEAERVKAEKESAAKIEAAEAEAARIVEDAKAEAARIRELEIEAARAEREKLEAARAAAEERAAAEARAIAEAELRAAEIAAQEQAEAEIKKAAEEAAAAKPETNLLLKKIREKSESNLLLKPKKQKTDALSPSTSSYQQPSSSDEIHNTRIVLQANTIYQEVAFSPPINRSLPAGIPALAASFRQVQRLNKLREQSTGEEQVGGNEASSRSNSAATVTPAAPIDPVSQFGAKKLSKSNSETPNRLTLRAEPMSHAEALGRHVQVRFKLHQSDRHANVPTLDRRN